MIIKLYKPEEPKLEPTMRVYLQEVGGIDNNIQVRVIDDEGKEWSVLAINKEGKILRYTGIDKDTGWPIDNLGRLKLISE